MKSELLAFYQEHIMHPMVPFWESAVDQRQLLDSITARIAQGSFKSEPYPVPDGFRNYAIPMILLNIKQEMAEALSSIGHPRTREIREEARSHVYTLVEDFRLEDDRVRNMLPVRPGLEESLLARHTCPGHVLEGLWFAMAELRRFEDQQESKRLLDLCTRQILRMFDLGWDENYGGLLRFTDIEGGPPVGEELGTRTDQLIKGTWDTKIWWVHAEVLHSLLLGYHLSQEEALLERYHKLHSYTFRTFPNHNMSVGEWVQIRDRLGNPLDKVVALPVKDPFHILRAMLLNVQLLAD